jgi:ribosome-associated protein
VTAIRVTDRVLIDENEITYDFVEASGPGGQNVNKVATAVQLRFDVRGSPSLPPDVRERLERLAGNRLTQDGVLILQAQRFRSQERNRRDALERLVDLIRQAVPEPKRRRRTKPTASSRRRRLEAKRHRAEIKRWRRRVRRDGE